MNLSSLTSSLTLSNPKPLFHSLPLSNKRQLITPVKVAAVSCSATAINNNDNNFYKMLSLSTESATMEEIKIAYRSMALRYHPDVCRDASTKEESNRMLVQLNAAYETLSNPHLRAEYDCKLSGSRSRLSVGCSDERWRIRWKQQLVELKRRSNRRMAQNWRSSWGSSMRAHEMKN